MVLYTTETCDITYRQVNYLETLNWPGKECWIQDGQYGRKSEVVLEKKLLICIKKGNPTHWDICLKGISLFKI